MADRHMRRTPGAASAVVGLIVNAAVMAVGLNAALGDVRSLDRVQVTPPPHCTIEQTGRPELPDGGIAAPCDPPPEGWMVQPLPGQPGGGTWADRAPFAGDAEHPPHPGLVPSDDPPGYRVVYPPGWGADEANANTTSSGRKPL